MRFLGFEGFTLFEFQTTRISPKAEEESMPSAPTRNAPIHRPSQVKTDDQFLRSSSPQAVTRMPHAEGGGQNGISSSPDEVVFLRLAGVKAMTGLSKSCLYLLIRENMFPAPVRIGNRAVAWVRSEVRQWALERIGAPR
jgi:prophage regulatory protein